MSVLVFVKKRRVSLDFASANGWSTWGTLIPTCFGWAVSGFHVIPLPDGFYERSRFCKKKDAFLCILPLPMVGAPGGHSSQHALAGLLVDSM